MHNTGNVVNDVLGLGQFKLPVPFCPISTQEIKDHMQEFLAEARSHGYEIPTPTLDGKIHRFEHGGSKDAGWYIGFQNHTVRSGQVYVVAQYGDWKTRTEHTHKPDSKTLTREDQEAIKKQLADASVRAAEEKRLRQIEAADKSERLFRRGVEIPESDYLSCKKVPGLFGTRTLLTDNGRTVLVPMTDEQGKLWGVQTIYPDGNKRFIAGQRVDGCFHRIGGEPEESAFICEGFATGCSIAMATGKAVFCAFNAGNLAAVAKALHRKHPDIRWIICGDDDRFIEVGNVGREKAEKAALVCQGAAKFPSFASDEGKPTDFNDLHIREGLEVVRSQLEEPLTVDNGFICLGYDEDVHFYYVFSARGIVKVTAYSEVQMLRLAPLSYWFGAYPSKTGVAWQEARDELIQKSQRVGPFNAFRIRGTGVWLDDGRVIVNDGQSLVVNDETHSMSSFESRHVYVQTRNRMQPIHAKPLTTDETAILREACELVRWRDDKSGYLLAGWLAIARIAGALPVRPHVWLTGGSGTGKSTVMDRIVRPALGTDSGKLYLQGGTTEAGIRQAIKADCLPIIFDEFETNNQETKQRVAATIELLRQSWSSTQGYILKGSSNGTATQYSLSFAALVSSIRVGLENDADRSRFSVLEIGGQKGDQDHWERLRKVIRQIDEDYGERLFARSCKLVKVILRSYDAIAQALAGNVSQRFGQQYGMLLAGYYSLVSDRACTSEIAERLVQDIDFREEAADASLTDESECLGHLLTHKISTTSEEGHRFEKTIGEIVADNSYREQAILKSYGVIVQEDAILIANEHSVLRQIYRDTRWLNWRKSLLRLEGATVFHAKWFGKKQSRCVRIPRNLFS